MAALTLAELRAEVRSLVADLKADDYSDQMITDALNWAVEEVARRTGATYVEVSANPSVGTGIWDWGRIDTTAAPFIKNIKIVRVFT